MDTETQQHLPQDLITEILLRLPVKSLVRFKAVCKFWRSLISGPHFARSHYELAARRLVFNTKLGIQTMDLGGWLHSNPISEPKNVDFLPSDSPIQIVGSCRGFVLLESEKRLYLWNPSTRVHKPIPSSPFHTNLSSHQYGFGYDSSKDDYLVVIVQVYFQSLPRWSVDMQLFSLRANMWKCIEATNLPCFSLFCISRPGMHFNGVIHWLSYDGDKSMDVIIAFDLIEKRFSEIPRPSGPGCSLSFGEVWVHGRFLSLSVRRRDTLEIWVMKKYKVQSSWTKTLVLSMSDIPYLFPLCSTKGGDIVMDGSTKLVKYTDKGEFVEEHCVNPDHPKSLVFVYTESILSLPSVSEQS